MPASGSGPVGALLILAPLAAIPVFAIVGVPQFSSVVASPGADEDVAELGSVSAKPAPVHAPRRNADDLYASFPGSQPAAGSFGAHRSAPQTAPRARVAIASESAWVPPAEALDDWQVSQAEPDDRTGRFDRDGAPLRSGQIPRGPSVNSTGSRLRERPQFDDLDDSPSTALRSGADTANQPGHRNRPVVSVGEFDGGLLENPAAGSGRPPAAPPTRGRITPSARSPLTESPPGERAFETETRPEAIQGGMPPAGLQPSGWQSAAQRLKSLGIRQYRLECRIEEQRFVFRCIFPTGEAGDMTRLFEADAEDPLDAVLQVLEQVDEWQSSRTTFERSRENR